MRGGRLLPADDPGLLTEGTFAAALESLARAYAPAGAAPRALVRLCRAGQPSSDADDFLVWCAVGADGAPRPDFELYSRDCAPTARLRVAFDRRGTQAADARYEAILGEWRASPRPWRALTDAPRAFHVRLLTALVERRLGADDDARARAMYSAFKILLPQGDAFVDRDGVRVWRANAWHLDAPARHGLDADSRAENDVVIGFVADRRDNDMATAVFKLRPPRRALRGDARNRARGAACETRPRAELARIVQRLPATQPPAHGSLCGQMRDLLLGAEAAARQRGGLRWLYLFNERGGQS